MIFQTTIGGGMAFQAMIRSVRPPYGSAMKPW